MFKLVRVSLVIAVAMMMFAFAGNATPAAAQNEDGTRFVPRELLIQFRDGTTEAQQQAARARISAVVKSRLRARADGRSKLEVASLPDRADVKAAIQAIKADASIEFAEPNWIYTTDATSNDPYYTDGTLWGMYGKSTTPANQYGSNAAAAWAAGNTGSKGVYVGVIDEGIQFTHPDLAANIWTNPFDAADGKDNDGNGYVDDQHGWDFANGDNSVYDAGGDEHGTHVSGTIGGVGGNGTGVAGVNWNVTLISGKFLGTSGGTTEAAIKAVDYFTDLKTRHGLNIVATSNSWGGGGYSQALQDAIIRGAKADILFVAAAGNGNFLGRALNNDRRANYPSNYDTSKGTSTESAASYDAVIAVAAIDKNGAKASFSNYGATTVDIGAPGVAVTSTVPTNSYDSYSGTSMATPHVSGAVALYASVKPGTSAKAIKNAILSSAVATSSLNGITVTGGRLDVNAALSK